MNAAVKSSAWAVQLAGSRSVALTKVNAAPSAKSDRNGNVTQIYLKADRIIQSISAADAFAALLKAAFPGASENAICVEAEKAGVCGENVARRIMRGHTKHASAVVIGRLAIFCLVRGIDPLKAAGLADIYDQLRGES